MINREKTFECLKLKEINAQYGGSQFCLYIRNTWAIKKYIYCFLESTSRDSFNWSRLGTRHWYFFKKKFPGNSKTELWLKSSNIDYISNRKPTRKGWNANTKMGKEYEQLIFRTEITNA